MKTFFEKHKEIGSCSDYFFIFFHNLFDIVFRIDLFIDF